MVDIVSQWEDDDRTVACRAFRIVSYDTPRGCAAAYYPETNPLVPLDSTANRQQLPDVEVDHRQAAAIAGSGKSQLSDGQSARNGRRLVAQVRPRTAPSVLAGVRGDRVRGRSNRPGATRRIESVPAVEDAAMGDESAKSRGVERTVLFPFWSAVGPGPRRRPLPRRTSRLQIGPALLRHCRWLAGPSRQPKHPVVASAPQHLVPASRVYHRCSA